MLEKTEGTIKNGQSREIGNIWYIIHTTKYKQNKKHNTICVGHKYTQRNTNNINKT